MRMDTTRGQSAADWLAVASQQQIAEVIRDYGEERFAGAIAKAIVARRQAGHPVARTLEFAELVAGAVRTREPGRTQRRAPSRLFGFSSTPSLKSSAGARSESARAATWRPPGGDQLPFAGRPHRQAVHRPPRHAVVDRRAPFAEPAPTLRALGRVRPGAAEVAANPRARSAIMRVAERTEVAAKRGGQVS
jgi:16S rRNA (cytosine1402-N4)-methyltransferase